MKNLLFCSREVWKDYEPCGHPGCLSHLSRPCEGCGRIGGRSDLAAQITVYVSHQKHGLATLEQIVYTIGTDHSQTRQVVEEMQRAGILAIDNLYLVKLVPG